MKIEKDITIRVSINELKELVIEFNQSVYGENKKQIEELVEASLFSVSPRNIVINLDQLENNLFIHVDFDSAEEIKDLLKNNIASIFPMNIITEIEDNVRGYVEVYSDDEYSIKLFQLGFGELEF